MNRSANFFRLNPFERHKLLINEYLLTTPGALDLLKRDPSRDKRDIDVVRENHRFLWSDEDGEASTWGEKLAKKYYDKLFKEYCICDLSRYKENKVALRWRVEQEVVDGKGQFECGNMKCSEREQLTSWEVNFGYREQGEKKNALIKLRLCPPCSNKLNYHHKKKQARSHKERKRSSESASADEETEEDRQNKRLRLEKETSAAEGSSKESESSKAPEVADDGKLWRDTGGSVPTKSREMEFQEYFDELFM